MAWDKNQGIKNDASYLDPRVTNNESKIGDLSQTNYNDVASGLKDHTSQLAQTMNYLADLGVNIRKWGAVEDDGTVDNRLVIQDAIDYLISEGGGTLYIPKGTFYISLDGTSKIGLAIKGSNIKVAGEGTIKLKDGQLSGTIDYSPLMILVDTVSSNETDTLENVTIEGITIDQNWQNNHCIYTGYSVDALTVRHCVNADVNRTKIINVIDSAIMFTSNRRSRIHDNYIEAVLRKVTDGTITSGTNTLTSTNANFISADVGSTVYIKGAGSAGEPFRATITGINSSSEVNLSINASTTVSGALTWIGTADAGIYVSDYWLSSNDGSEPFSSENTREDRTQDIIISNNNIENFLGNAIHCHRGPSRMLITHNTIRNAWVGLDLSFANQETSGYTAIPQKNKVSNNQFEDIARIGIALNLAHFSSVNNNSVLNSFIGIDLQGSSYCNVSNNTLTGTLEAVGNQYGILLAVGSKDGVDVYASYNTIACNTVTKFWNGIKDVNGCIGNLYTANGLKWNRSETATAPLYIFDSTNRCVDGVWYASDLTASPIPQEEGTLGVKGDALWMYVKGVWRRKLIPATNPYTVGSATINVADADFVMVNTNTTATNVTDIVGGMLGQEITLYFTNANTTLVYNGSKIRLHGKVSYTPPSQTSVKLVCLDGTIWAEVSRTEG